MSSLLLSTRDRFSCIETYEHTHVLFGALGCVPRTTVFVCPQRLLIYCIWAQDLLRISPVSPAKPVLQPPPPPPAFEIPPPVTVDGTTHAHLVRMCWPLLWGLHQKMRCSSATCGAYALVGSLRWIMSAQLSRLEAVVVASPKSPESPDITPMASQTQTLAVCLHQWRVPHFALKYPCNPQGGGPSLGSRLPPPRGDRRVLWGEISRGGRVVELMLVLN